MLFFTGYRRKRLKEQPFPPPWERILERRFPLYGRLSSEDRLELQGHIQVFLAEKRFEAAQGLLLTDDITVAIAAGACLLLLHRDTDYYPGLSSIVVYPGEFVAPYSESDEAGIVTEGDDIRSGESWLQGTLVISWEDVLLCGREGYEDYNVIIHEFAHQLDAEYGITGGEPLLGKRRRWGGVLEEEFERFRADVERDLPTFLDPYGAESPAEFFAVATETFFTVPEEFREELPELYGELVGLYRQDPASWSPAS